MPRISSFYGIVIWMYFDEPQHEGRPHFHATYGDDEPPSTSTTSS